MKTKKTILSFLIAIFSLFTLTACEGCGSVPKKPKSKDDTITLNLSNPKNIIVLLHGLGCPKDSGIADLGSKLAVDIKNSEIIVLDRENSGAVSTMQQAEETYVALKKELEKKKLIDSPICLIGDSHGGLVALELYRNHKKDLDITGIITNHSPLEGAPGVNASDKNIKKFKEKIKKMMLNSDDILIQGGAIFLDRINLKKVLTGNIKQPMIQDLTEGSQLLEDVRSTLSNIDIPVLIIGGKVEIKIAILALLNFVSGPDLPIESMIPRIKNTLDKLSIDDLNKLEKRFDLVIGDKENDCFLPYYSQMGTSFSENQKVERFSSRSYHHFYGIADHKLVYNKLIEFINIALKFKN